MDRYRSGSRATSPRKPLGDATSKANKLAPKPTSKLRQSPLKLNTAVARNESLVGDGCLSVRHTMESPDNKRLSKVSADNKTQPKHNSANSTASNSVSPGARQRKRHIGPWQLGRTIGRGGTAQVREVRHSITGQEAVAKVVMKAMAEKSRAVSLANLVKYAEDGDPSLIFGRPMPLGLEREIAIMKLLDHNNIVRLYDVWENHNEMLVLASCAKALLRRVVD
jgi:serine/threonine-protein kinase HSL1 (negative regulator of Swe1 kinase)